MTEKKPEAEISFKSAGINYRNSRGEPVPKVEQEKELLEFRHWVDSQYEAKVAEFVESVPEKASESEKVKAVFDYILNHVSYDHKEPDASGCVSVEPYDLGWGDFRLQMSEKESPLLSGRGVCAGIAPLTEDLLSRLGIESRQLFGETRVVDEKTGRRLQHVWNAVRVGEEYKHLDLVHAMYRLEDNKNPYDFFLVDDARLNEFAPHSGYDKTLFNLESIK